MLSHNKNELSEQHSVIKWPSLAHLQGFNISYTVFNIIGKMAQIVQLRNNHNIHHIH